MNMNVSNHPQAKQRTHFHLSDAPARGSMPIQRTEEPRIRTRAGIPMPSRPRARWGGAGHGA